MLSQPVATSIVNGTYVEETERSFQVDDPAATSVVVANVNGPVTISAWDEPQVWIHARKSAHGERAFERTRVEFRQEGNQISAITHVDEHNSLFGILDALLHSGSANVEYTVRVPAGCAVRVKTVNGPIAATGLRQRLDAKSVNGPILLKEIDGVLDAETVNGPLKAERISGEAKFGAVHGSLDLLEARLRSLSAHTVNGNLHAAIDIDPDGIYSFNTTNGSCHLSLPRASRLRVKMNAVNGGVHCDLPHEVVASEKFPTLRRWEAVVNGGGATVQFKTVNGRLTISGADSSVPLIASSERETSLESQGDHAEESRTMEILRAVERGEISVDDALRQL